MAPFHKNLKSWRLFRGLTQRELAERAGLPRPNLVALEKGWRECTLTTLHRLAYVLQITPGELIDKMPPVQESSDLDRHEIDRMARDLLEGQRNWPPSMRKIMGEIASEAEPLLRAGGVSRKVRNRRARSVDVKNDTAQRILSRLSKLLASRLTGGPSEKR